jgi:hypothetical protein
MQLRRGIEYIIVEASEKALPFILRIYVCHKGIATTHVKDLFLIPIGSSPFSLSGDALPDSAAGLPAWWTGRRSAPTLPATLETRYCLLERGRSKKHDRAS